MKIVTGIFAIVIAVGCFWFSLKLIALYFEVKGWDRIIATVLSKEVTLHKKYSTGRTPYKLNATFSYEYKNQKYTGNMIYLIELEGGQANHMKSDADSRIAEIKDQMEIYVNPEKPQQSVMYCDGVGLYFFVFAMGVFALLFGIVKLLV